MPDETHHSDAQQRPGARVPVNVALLAGAIGTLIAGPAPHVVRHIARVDERLAELPNDECRRGFLGDELAKWEARYIAYCEKVDTHKPTDEQVTAWDYVETMGELEKRIAKYRVTA